MSPGLYLSPSVFPIGIVVISALPRSRETLLLRLMGDRAVREQATRDLLEIPDADPEKWPLLRLLGSLLRAMGRGKKRGSNESTEEEPMSEAWAEIERHEKNLMNRGIEQGLARSILKFLKARHLEVSEAVQQRILSTTDPVLLDRWIERAVSASTADEVVAAD